MTHEKNGTRDLWGHVENETVQVSEKWRSLNDKERFELVKNLVDSYSTNRDLQPILCGEDGMIFFEQVVPMPVNLRADTLLDLEAKLKAALDEGLTVWIQPQSDKNTLRKLRGVEVKSL
jgi:hypothetical protein